MPNHLEERANRDRASEQNHERNRQRQSGEARRINSRTKVASRTGCISVSAAIFAIDAFGAAGSKFGGTTQGPGYCRTERRAEDNDYEDRHDRSPFVHAYGLPPRGAGQTSFMAIAEMSPVRSRAGRLVRRRYERRITTSVPFRRIADQSHRVCRTGARIDRRGDAVDPPA